MYTNTLLWPKSNIYNCLELTEIYVFMEAILIICGHLPAKKPKQCAQVGIVWKLFSILVSELHMQYVREFLAGNQLYEF